MSFVCIISHPFQRPAKSRQSRWQPTSKDIDDDEGTDDDNNKDDDIDGDDDDDDDVDGVDDDEVLFLVSDFGFGKFRIKSQEVPFE